MTDTGPGPTSGWLVVVDMQQVFAASDSPWRTPGFDAVVAPIRRLIDAFGARVVFTRFVAPAEPAGAWVDYYRDWPFALVPAVDPIYDLVDTLDHHGRPVVTRTTFGKWDDLPGSLRELTGGAGELTLVGVSTDCCVLSTALAAADAGVRVEVVADGCAGLSDADHQRALEAMRLYTPLISITSASEVLTRP